MTTPHRILTTGLLLLATSALSASSAQKSLFAYVGAGIKEPVTELAGMFQKETGVTVEMTFGNSGALASQLSLGGAGDIFMPGSSQFVKKAKAEGLIDTVGAAIAYHVPVVIVPKGNPAGIRGVADLARPGLKLILPDRKATALGKQAFEMFGRLGVADSVERNVLAYAETPQKVVASLSMGLGDAGVVDFSNVAKLSDKFDVIEIDPGINVVEELPCAVLSGSTRKADAKAFLEFVSRKGPAVFARHGFRTAR